MKSCADALLLRCTAPFAEPAIMANAFDDGARIHRISLVEHEIWKSLDASTVYAYLWLAPNCAIDDNAFAALRDTLAARLAPSMGRVEIGRLYGLTQIDGPAHDAFAPFHYVVETDVEPAAEDDFNAWYDQEHLPGLAAVPGNLRARRLRSVDLPPRSHACYDLVSDALLSSPAWLAVRASAWSDRVRPHFRNTRRTMFVRGVE
jgi:hypothetical protein